MREFMMLIRAEGDPVAELSPDDAQRHVEKVGGYIQNLINEGRLKDAQPLEMRGAMISARDGILSDGPFNESKEVIAGYYLIKAADLAAAVEIAKADPRFQDGDWKIEVRPLRKVEGIN